MHFGLKSSLHLSAWVSRLHHDSMPAWPSFLNRVREKTWKLSTGVWCRVASMPRCMLTCANTYTPVYLLLESRSLFSYSTKDPVRRKNLLLQTASNLTLSLCYSQPLLQLTWTDSKLLNAMKLFLPLSAMVIGVTLAAPAQLAGETGLYKRVCSCTQDQISKSSLACQN